MPYAALRNSLLAARDARHEEFCRVLRAGERSVVCLALNLPGAEKHPPGAAGLLAWARQRLAEALPGLSERCCGLDCLGPYAIFAGEGEPARVKRACVQLEAARPFTRLLDLDVYDRRGRPVDRALLGLPPRGCLLCGEPALECIRLGRHDGRELKAKTRELLLPFTD